MEKWQWMRAVNNIKDVGVKYPEKGTIKNRMTWTSSMAQQVKVLNTKHDSLTSVHGKKESAPESHALAMQYRIIL